MPDGWVTVAVKERVEALMIQGLLAAAGLPVRLLGEPLGNIYGLNIGPLGLVQVQVPAGAAGQARDILAARFRGEAAHDR
ncbi:MAG: hypothetical protein PWR22_753 [Moorella sp. (in: firmicutes)]|jgi:hypothetical protein|uniref:putative signal transducing protein n=1 Tax=unclassified Neomoorella TaxID=2676739 RepID=UPI0010FFBBE0|nr:MULTISPECIES: hypothetical protein [unclassified Moorella (in: firmicutes)]MDK2816124.1 hypothetical protein [Moorella sp. (in: firmicutes)]MDK2895151.1 hypothetical protein [Moorella sp. (in: firmicutes)]GEA15049.1 hypothetical protein E308F_12930 [Moorella sp. E308F]GEA17052.1 hypothetical protein E306M_01860 [Moorella sp. E306M]